MNNYVSFLLEADAAKKRLAQIFESGAPGETRQRLPFLTPVAQTARRTRLAVSES